MALFHSTSEAKVPTIRRMFGIGFQEVMIIFVVVLIVFGPKKMPELARMIGRSLGEFRRVTQDLKSAIDFDGLNDRKPQQSTRPVSPPPPKPGKVDEPVALIPDKATPSYSDDEIEMPDPGADSSPVESLPTDNVAQNKPAAELAEDRNNAGTS